MFEERYRNSGEDTEGEDFMPIVTIEENDETSALDEIPAMLPLVALKNTVLFPGNVIPITIGRDKSIKAIQYAYESTKLVGVLSQRDASIENPAEADLYHVGTVARIVKLLKMPDGNTTAILQGRRRFELKGMLGTEPFLQGSAEILQSHMPEQTLEFDALIRSINELARDIINLSPNIPSEASLMLDNIDKPAFLLNFIASNMSLKIADKQNLLEINDLAAKAKAIIAHMNNELQVLRIKGQIDNKVRVDIEKQQRDYFLNQQLRTIQEELGQSTPEKELDELEKKARGKKWPEHVSKAFNREMKKARRTNPAMPEYGVTLTYLELLLDLPWEKYTKDNFDLNRVEKVLDKDHFGLEKVKERILEHLAVLKLKGDLKAPIICLAGPPGVGKTSLGKSVANALNRNYIRISLGGLHDESEIRGHRKTYIGAMPGRIVQSLRKAQSSNPVFILDEIDKVGKDFRGDPSSALLEVLDPEQNATFYDNYLELEYDLSKVLFIATANSLNSIQSALLDRMEVIHISGYSEEEKIEIAKRHLIPRQRKEHGLKSEQVSIRKSALSALIRDYTRESGVRELERRIAAVMRHVAKNVAMDAPYPRHISNDNVASILGPRKYSRDAYQIAGIPGVTIGLAWTPVGGDILFVETSLSKGKGNITLTGNLGDVMKESATTALSYLKARAEKLDIPMDSFDQQNIHIHVPEGAIPKDGPSAGITMLVSVASAYLKKNVKDYLAMSGEITLRGKVLPVGGIKEKVLAARRAGIREIILSKDNEKDVNEIKAEYLEGLTFHYTSSMDEVLSIALA